VVLLWYSNYSYRCPILRESGEGGIFASPLAYATEMRDCMACGGTLGASPAAPCFIILCWCPVEFVQMGDFAARRLVFSMGEGNTWI